jgi:cytochrome P450
LHSDYPGGEARNRATPAAGPHPPAKRETGQARPIGLDDMIAMRSSTWPGAMKRFSGQLPAGPRAPAAVQTIASWTRPTAWLDRARARYGSRFTIRFLGQPPFVVLSDPEEIKEVFMAPPEVLHPGEGAKVLEPIVGPNSVILLDEAPHLEQRKLMLPAFHGERMQRLEGVMTELTERELASWPLGEEIELHPRLQRLTLEIVLRAVFGLERGARGTARIGQTTHCDPRPRRVERTHVI